MSKLKLLDCTLRDGGFYNNWDFDLELARRTVESLANSGVDMIELGYKSIAKNGYAGLFKYCNEEYLQFAHDYQHVDFAFMIDIKNFINKTIDYELLDQIIPAKNKSLFNWCRLASHYNTIEYIPELVAYFREKEYQIGVNLMGISLLAEDDFKQAINYLGQANPDVFYFADSFGSLYPKDINKIVQLIRNDYKGEIGFHAHDNQGLAFANSLTAIEAGVNYIDGTLNGMGRGAGNANIEQLLAWAQIHSDTGHQYKPNSLLEILLEYYQPMRSKYGWGYNHVYMLSGLNNIHPSFCMAISEGNKFSMSQISSVLEDIPASQKSVFDSNALKTSINKVMHNVQQDQTQLLEKTDLKAIKADYNSALILAPGERLNKYREAIQIFLTNHRMRLIECNHTGIVDNINDRYMIVLNKMRLNEILADEQSHAKSHIITGENVNHEESISMSHFKYEIGELNVDEQSISIPDFEAGQYAISIALAAGFEKIIIAGFTGYDESARNVVMDNYFKAILKKFKSVEITAITPTRYKYITEKSIFAY